MPCSATIGKKHREIVLVRPLVSFAAAAFFLFVSVPFVRAADYRVQKVAEGVFAAIAVPGGKAVSNAMIIIAGDEVMLAGAHFTKDGTSELLSEIGKLTPLPLRRIILTHHHRGYNYFDYDFPPSMEIVMSWQTWQAVKEGYREMKNPVSLFETGMTFHRRKMTVVLRNTGLGHSEGDVIVFLPDVQALFASDLLFNGAVGFMGDGHMREWVAGLQMLERLQPRVVIPGVGAVTDTDGIGRFRIFLQDFFTELLRHLEKGETLAQTKKAFRLPRYEGMPGFGAYLDINVERGYRDLQNSSGK